MKCFGKRCAVGLCEFNLITPNWSRDFFVHTAIVIQHWLPFLYIGMFIIVEEMHPQHGFPALLAVYKFRDRSSKVFLWFSYNGAGWSVASLRLISSPDHIFAVEIRPRRGVYALISAHLRLLLFCYLAYQSTDVGTVIRSGWSSSVMIGEEKERVLGQRIALPPAIEKPWKGEEVSLEWSSSR